MKLLESQIGKINIFAGQLFATKAFSNNIIRSTSNVYFQCKIHAYFYFYFSRNMLSISKYLGYLLYLCVWVSGVAGNGGYCLQIIKYLGSVLIL